MVMSFLRLLCFGLLVFGIMYAIAVYVTKEQREYLMHPTRDEQMAQECRLALHNFEVYNNDAFEDWENRYGKGFTAYAALRTLEATRLRYGHKMQLKGWTEYNASR